MRRSLKLLIGGVATLLAPAALAAGAAPSAGPGAPPPIGMASAAPAMTPASPSASAPHNHPDAGPAETKDQRAFRRKYVAETVEKENTLLKGLVRTPDVHRAVTNHWHRAYRTLRVRELAEDSADAATVARTDAHLHKIDAHFFAYLAELAPSLPPIAAAPSIAAPAPGAQIPIGSALTITVTPGGGAAPNEYYCVASEGGAHALVNYDAAGKHYGLDGNCTFAANDPRWAKFHPGKGGIWAATVIKAKTAKGAEYRQWSHQKYIPVQFVAAGGAPAPAASGGAQ